MEQATVAIQGFGNVGRIAAELFEHAGSRIVALSDSEGGIFCADGINLKEAIEFKSKHGTLVGLHGTQSVSNDELLETECDVLLPAALENQIHAGNADRIHAKMICEGANGPTTPAADQILHARGIPVLPDILANGGGRHGQLL